MRRLDCRLVTLLGAALLLGVAILWPPVTLASTRAEASAIINQITVYGYPACRPVGLSWSGNNYPGSGVSAWWGPSYPSSAGPGSTRYGYPPCAGDYLSNRGGYYVPSPGGYVIP
jgi:hypothetical protein